MRHDWFAWFPVRTLEGTWVWMCTVKREWDWELNPWGDIRGHSGTDGGWRYSKVNR